MSIRRSTPVWMPQALAVLAFVVAWPVQGANCDEISTMRLSRLQLAETLDANDCLGGARDQTALAREVRKLSAEVPEDKKSVIEQQNATRAILEEIRTRATRQIQDGSGSPVSLVVVALDRAIANLDAMDAITSPEAWNFDPGQGQRLNEVVPFNPASYLNGRCGEIWKENYTDACNAAYEDTLSALRLANLTEAALRHWRLPEIQAERDRVALLGREWNAYFNDARSQYPWELWINGRYTVHACSGSKGGYRDVPRWQIIAAHPDVALEYVEDAVDGSRQRAVAILEVLGVNAWRYRDGAMGPAIGGSLIFTASDRAGVEARAWGILVHVNHRYSLGVTRRGRHVGYVLGADLAKLWTKASEKAKARLSGHS